MFWIGLFCCWVLSVSGDDRDVTTAAAPGFMRSCCKCSRPDEWCTQQGAVFEFRDCDGDGIEDPYCYDGPNSGYLGSASDCHSNWPKGVCRDSAHTPTAGNTLTPAPEYTKLLPTTLPTNPTPSPTRICWDGPYRGRFLPGCVPGDDCKNHRSRAAAERACIKAGPACGGILTAGPGHWEIRVGSTPIGSTHETSYVKVPCAKPTVMPTMELTTVPTVAPTPAPATSPTSAPRMIPTPAPPMAPTPAPSLVCWDGPYNNQYLLGCVPDDDCKNHGSRAAAEIACANAGKECGGIFMTDPGHWEIRAGSVPTGSTHGTSYVKVPCETPTSSPTIAPEGKCQIFAETPSGNRGPLAVWGLHTGDDSGLYVRWHKGEYQSCPRPACDFYISSVGGGRYKIEAEDLKGNRGPIGVWGLQYGPYDGLYVRWYKGDYQFCPRPQCDFYIVSLGDGKYKIEAEALSGNRGPLAVWGMHYADRSGLYVRWYNADYSSCRPPACDFYISCPHSVGGVSFGGIENDVLPPP